MTYIETPSTHKLALDYGCGTGNLTKHLIELGLTVVSADISDKFLRLIKQRYVLSGMSDILKINGQDLSNIEDNRFDFAGAYSVLHHVPDYLSIIEEMIRVTRYGGIIYLDHEVNDSYWHRNRQYIEFQQLVKSQKIPSVFVNLKKYFKPTNYVNWLKHIANPRYTTEGDIHVWPDDHIDWDAIKSILISHGCELVFERDYLLYRKSYPLDIYNKYKDKCNDVHIVIARKRLKKLQR